MSIFVFGKKNYISLTDIARHKDSEHANEADLLNVALFEMPK